MTFIEIKLQQLSIFSAGQRKEKERIVNVNRKVPKLTHFFSIKVLPIILPPSSRQRQTAYMCRCLAKKRVWHVNTLFAQTASDTWTIYSKTTVSLAGIVTF